MGEMRFTRFYDCALRTAIELAKVPLCFLGGRIAREGSSRLGTFFNRLSRINRWSEKADNRARCEEASRKNETDIQLRYGQAEIEF